MAQPEGDELAAIRTHRDELRATYLVPLGDRPATTVRGVHHIALVCRDVEETIRFYQGFLGFPLVELVENRDYAGSSHFFFDIGNRNLLGFFDFPGLDSPSWVETIGAVQHLAISIGAEQFAAAKERLDASGTDYVGPDRGADDSLYIRDPNGVGIELYREDLGVFEGTPLLPDCDRDLMRSFVRDGSPRVVFGAGTLGQAAGELELLGGKRALVLSTPGRQALAARVAEQLGGAVAGMFSRAVMHTPVDVTEQAIGRARELRADSVVSIGGGSTTGLGKAIAAGTGLPHLVLPTTYAGSEVTPVLGETADGQKTTRSAPEILPDTVIYDVELTMALPWPVTVTSAVNAMAHSVEALYSADRTGETDRTALDSLTALAAGLRALRARDDDPDARADLLYGAWLAGRCLAAVGMGLHHKLCHTLGGSFGLPHAGTHTVVLPYAMDYNQPAAESAMAAAAAALGVGDAPAGLQSLVGDLDGPRSLAELGFDLADVPRAAELATARPYPNPRRVERDAIADLLTRATRGDTLGAHR